MRTRKPRLATRKSFPDDRERHKRSPTRRGPISAAPASAAGACIPRGPSHLGTQALRAVVTIIYHLKRGCQRWLNWQSY